MRAASAVWLLVGCGAAPSPAPPAGTVLRWAPVEGTTDRVELALDRPSPIEQALAARSPPSAPVRLRFR